MLIVKERKKIIFESATLEFFLISNWVAKIGVLKKELKSFRNGIKRKQKIQNKDRANLSSVRDGCALFLYSSFPRLVDLRSLPQKRCLPELYFCFFALLLVFSLKE